MSLEKNIKERANYWSTAAVFDEKTRKEIIDLLGRANDLAAEKELLDRFYCDLEFGTGGLRGVLGAGTNRMNIFNVKKASLALSTYLKKAFPTEKDLRIAISHDSRRFSREFACAAAEVFAGSGIKAMITKELRPVPMLSFMVRHFSCQAGICVTASHNPPMYNGYKVYWNTGGQIVPPHDQEVIKIYNSIKGYEDIPSISYKDGLQKKKIVEIGKELDDPYFAKVEALSLRPGVGRDLKIVYSPLHGTGLYPVTESLRRYGFKNVTVVPEQRDPDGNFPTVKYPNPEDPAALDMAIKLGQKEKADLIIATDPDCDRIGFVVRDGDQYFMPNGNQIGVLLIEYVLSSLKETGKLPSNPLVIKTIVTTDLQKDIAKHYGASCDETLTGFKWICQLIEDYESGKKKPYRKYICGGEESYGFLADSFVRDKDGVIGSSLTAEMVAWYKSKGLSLSKVLDECFSRHGVYQESLYNLTLPGKDGAETIKRMMTRMRESPPTKIDGVPVRNLRDFQLRHEFQSTPEGFKKVNDLALPRSDVLQFMLEDGTKVSVRPSGTEPKIKFYVSVREPQKGLSGSELSGAKERCLARVKRIEETFLDLAKHS